MLSSILSKSLIGATLSNVEEVGWDEDSDEELSTPQAEASSSLPKLSDAAPSSTLTTPITIAAPSATEETATVETDTLKPSEPRKSQDQHSQPDSDASYDLVSGATSRAPPSPREEKKDPGGKKDEEEEEEDDWE